MKSTILSLTFILLLAGFCKAQGTLQFNRAVSITSALQTVPSGKVWKVTSIYGADRSCIPCVYPDYSVSTSWCVSGSYVNYVSTGMIVNGVNVYSYRAWTTASSGANMTIYNESTCTTVSNTGNAKGWAAFDIPPNPNLLPMWLAAGTTLKTSSSNIFISALEFNIIP